MGWLEGKKGVRKRGEEGVERDGPLDFITWIRPRLLGPGGGGERSSRAARLGRKRPDEKW